MHGHRRHSSFCEKTELYETITATYVNKGKCQRMQIGKNYRFLDRVNKTLN